MRRSMHPCSPNPIDRRPARPAPPWRRGALLASLVVTVAIAAPRAWAAEPETRQTRIGAASGPVPEIILYTMGQGDVIFEKFGHGALCAEYPEAPRNSRCYN